MKVLSTRRITNDRHHNAFTGACWFKGDLYIGYRQGDVHMEHDSGRVIVQRSRDGGVTWDTVAVLRGHFDTRDAHLYTDGSRLYCTCYVDPTDSLPVVSGTLTQAAERDIAQEILDKLWIEDIVGPAVFLASRAAAMVTGTILTVDGGHT